MECGGMKGTTYNAIWSVENKNGVRCQLIFLWDDGLRNKRPRQ